MFNFSASKTIFSRNRSMLIICIFAVIVLGLASRKYAFLFPASLGKYPGDALWSLMVYFLWAFFRPITSPYRIATYALVTSYLDEMSQLIQAPWLNVIRHTTLGHLILGTVFSWHDILWYTIGIGVGLSLEIIIFHFE